MNLKLIFSRNKIIITTILIVIFIVGWSIDAKLNRLSSIEQEFLYQEGLIGKQSLIAPRYTDTLPANLIFQEFTDTPYRLRVLTSRLSTQTYRLILALENPTNQYKDFTFIPFSSDYLVFSGIRGRAGDEKIRKTSTNTLSDSLDDIYDIESHKSRLLPELAEVYDYLEQDLYRARPIIVNLPAGSKFLLSIDWQLATSSRPLKPAYLLLLDPASGFKEDFNQ